MKATIRLLLLTGICAFLVGGPFAVVHGQLNPKSRKELSQPSKGGENENRLDKIQEEKPVLDEGMDDYFEVEEAEGDEEQSGSRTGQQADQNQPRPDLMSLPETEEYQAGKIRVKIDPGYRGQCTPQEIAVNSLKLKMNKIGVTKIARSFPQAYPPSEVTDKYGREYVDLSLVYEITFDPNFSVQEAVKLLENDPAILYVEPAYILQEFYSPNDPKYPNQYHLGLIRAADAWDISRGDTSIVIGIIDTGISLTHPDLTNQIAYNWNDPIDGIDNDGDGYKDNFHGWDFGGGGLAGPDNNPTYNGTDHGVLVAGAAAADTDNGSDIAAPAFDCKILPIKVTRDNSNGVIYGYSGMIYAADHGAQIINCSWGSGAASQFGEDAVNYCAINKGCLVVCAAGNTPIFYNVYPAAYENSLSVGGTSYGDEVWYDTPSFGTSWNYEVDLCAPAKNVRTTVRHAGSWWGATGTSVASPLVAGAAGVVKAHFPNYSMFQVGQKLRVTADDIYGINPAHQDLLGKGRLNMHAALTTASPSIRLDELLYADANNNVPEGFDTVSVSVKVFNWLDATNNLNVEIVSMDPGMIEVVNGSAAVGVVNTLATGVNSQPIRIVIKQPVESATPIWVKLVYTDAGTNYTDFEYAQLYVQPTSINIEENNVAITISDDGNFGFTNSFPASDELGFRYLNGPNLMNGSGGFLIGTGIGQVSDCVQGTFFGPETEFQAIAGTGFNRSTSHTDLVVTNQYNDSRNTSAPMGVKVTQTILADTKAEYDDFLIFEYLVENESNTDYPGVRTGFFSDWDMTHSAYDAELNMIYSWNTDSVNYPFVALVALDAEDANVSTFDKTTYSLSTLNKWNALDNVQAPKTLNNGDVLAFASSSKFDLMAGTETTVAFAMVAADNLTKLRRNAQSAWEKYHCDVYTRLPDPLDLGPDQGICPGQSTEIVADSGYANYLWSTGFDGVRIPVNQAGTYTLEVQNEYFCSRTDEVTIEAFAAPAPDMGGGQSLCAGDQTTLDPGAGFASYSWSNGSDQPVIQVSQAGEYTVTVTNANGCVGTDVIKILQFPDYAPNLSPEYKICSGSALTLDPGFGYVAHSWAHGPSTREVEVNYPGTYTVFLTDGNGCTYTGETDVVVVDAPELDLGPNLSVCEGEVIVLDAGDDFKSYTWSNGAESSTIEVGQSGAYRVTVEAENGCTAEAEVAVEIHPVPEVDLGDNLQLCQSSELDCGIPNAAYLWSNGETTRSIWVEKSGLYEVQVYTNAGCQGGAEVSVQIEKLSAGFDVE